MSNEPTASAQWEANTDVLPQFDETLPASVVTLPPLYERRPQLVVQQIEQKWQELRDMPSYGYNGEDATYHFEGRGDASISSTDLIDELAETRNRPLRILDIGCGIGQVVFASQQEGHDAHGITAFDYHEYDAIDEVLFKATGERRRILEVPRHNAGTYIIGDANNLDAIPGLYDDYDLILSSFALMHLVEPLGALEQAFERLSVGGILAFRSLRSPYYESQVRVRDDSVDGEFVLDSLKHTGLEVRDGWVGHASNTFAGTAAVSRRTAFTGDVHFPVEFARNGRLKTKWEYVKSA